MFAATRAQSSQGLAALARKIEPKNTWADIVLPDDALVQLRELCQRVAHWHRVFDDWGFARKLSLGTGVNALFAGPSGTGKTMAAEIIAAELGLDLYRIDLAQVVSKYIGETEKNLSRIFAAAENANAILFFDEADALFGKRSEVRDAHDRYANIEIAYLLQKMEEYDGLAILATSLSQNLDDAFARRLAFTIHFPFPDEIMRRRIWASVWPAEAPLGEDLQLDLLAGRFRQLPALGVSVFVLAGENTKNGEERVVLLNRVARSVVEECRGQHPEFVFTFQGKPIERMNNSAWRKARSAVGLDGVRVHDLRHTFGMRLRAAGVSLQDHQDLLGHKSGRITTHYSAAELGNLLAAVEKITEPVFQESPNLILVRARARAASV